MRNCGQTNLDKNWGKKIKKEKRRKNIIQKSKKIQKELNKSLQEAKPTIKATKIRLETTHGHNKSRNQVSKQQNMAKRPNKKRLLQITRETIEGVE